MHSKRFLWSIMLCTSHIMITTSCFLRHNSISCYSHLVTKCRKTRISRFGHIFTIPQTRNSSRIWSLLVSDTSTFSEIYIIKKTWWNLCQIMTIFWPVFSRFLSRYAYHDSSFARCSQLFNESLKTPENLQIWVSQNRYPSPRSFPTQRDADTPISGV
jgi:hypothetical protein